MKKSNLSNRGSEGLNVIWAQDRKLTAATADTAAAADAKLIKSEQTNEQTDRH